MTALTASPTVAKPKRSHHRKKTAPPVLPVPAAPPEPLDVPAFAPVTAAIGARANAAPPAEPNTEAAPQPDLQARMRAILIELRDADLGMKDEEAYDLIKRLKKTCRELLPQ